MTAFLEENKEKDFYQAIQHLQEKSRQSHIPTPCFNDQGNLLVDPEDILEERACYSAKLADDMTACLLTHILCVRSSVGNLDHEEKCSTWKKWAPHIPPKAPGQILRQLLTIDFTSSSHQANVMHMSHSGLTPNPVTSTNIGLPVPSTEIPHHRILPQPSKSW
ncbi:hypothetical protein O181_025052 [Austropuccinia psidii MF-1]|uniref:Uncharacterized protein n=1 Tax=Austropuccinia psidii MF-1 TaxID=1389203 RepID=A0A9Q3GZI2_9BASI|nr:hypothetical protein [Austropuccinia psidii MF-1]